MARRAAHRMCAVFRQYRDVLSKNPGAGREPPRFVRGREDRPLGTCGSSRAKCSGRLTVTLREERLPGFHPGYLFDASRESHWIPAFAGMTVVGYFDVSGVPLLARHPNDQLCRRCLCGYDGCGSNRCRTDTRPFDLLPLELVPQPVDRRHRIGTPTCLGDLPPQILHVAVDGAVADHAVIEIQRVDELVA